MGERRIVKGWIVERQPDGTIVPIEPAGGQMPADPTFPYKAPKAQADVQSTQVNTQGQALDNQVNQATVDARIRKAIAEAAAAEAAAAKAATDASKPQTMSEDERKAAGQRATLESIVGQINRVQELYNSGIRDESAYNLFGLLDAIGPTAGQFNSAGQGVADQGLNAFRTPGVGAQSDYEARQFALANTPSAGDWDKQIEEKLRTIRSRVDANRKALGLPPAQWTGVTGDQQQDPSPAGATGATPPPKIGGDMPPDMPSGMSDAIWKQQGPQGGQQIAGGATRNVPNPGAQALAAELNAMFARGESPEAIASYARMRGGQFGSDVAGQVRDMRAYNKANPKNRDDQPFVGGMMQVDNPLISQAVASPAFGGLAAATDSLSAGQVLSRVAGDEMDALRAAHPNATMGGDVLGAIGGTSALGKIGAKAAAKLAPQLLRGGRGANLARGLATDVTYGAAYGDATQDDALGGGLSAGLGSLAGRGIVKLGAGALTGVGGPVARRLAEADIRLTPGQIARGRGGFMGNLIANTEDRLAGFPGIGDMIGAARQAGIEDFTRADMSAATKNIGGKITAPGSGGFAQADSALGKAYRSALDPMQLQVDPQLQSAMAKSVDYAPAITDQLDNGILTGDGLQAAKQILNDEAQNLSRTPGGFRQVPQVRGLRDELMAAGDRQVPDLMAKYRAADEAFAALAPIRQAVASAVNKGGLYTPAQKGIGLRVTDKSVGKRATAMGNRPGMQLQQDAQQLLPSSVPDSGTAGRLALGALSLGSAGAGQQGYIDPTTAATLAIASGAYTKTGQKALQKLLVERSGVFGKSMRRAGIRVKKSQAGRALGAASIPLLIENQN